MRTVLIAHPIATAALSLAAQSALADHRKIERQ
jgi:hypothetical protein